MTSSYKLKNPPQGRFDEGLQAVFSSVFPITDFSGSAQLEFVRYEFELPKYDTEECRLAWHDLFCPAEADTSPYRVRGR